MLRSTVTQHGIAFLVLTLGTGVVWGLAAVISGSVIWAFIPQTPKNLEDVVLAADGTPHIRTRIAGSYQNTETRTLDGQTVDLPPNNWGLVGLGKPYQESGIIQEPITWDERIIGSNDNQKSLVSWLFMRDDERPGNAYLAGFDVITSYPVGYIGRDGFYSSLPPRDKWFNVGNHVFDWGHTGLTSSGQMIAGRPHVYRSSALLSKQLFMPWVLFLLEGNDILKIDLLKRTVSVVAELDEEVHSLRITWVPLRIEESEPLDPSENFNFNRTYINRLFARCSDRIIVLNPFGVSQQEFLLPAHLQHATFSACMPTEDQMILQVNQGKWEQGDVVDLLWINAEGEVGRKETLRLAGHVPEASWKIALQAAIAVPCLLVWIIVLLIIAPLGRLQSHPAESYMASLQEGLSECWPMFLALVVLSAILSWVAYRWQKTTCRSHTGLWCATIFLTTVSGLITYWFMHRNTVLESCGKCGKQAPRDRDACGYCEKPFAEPKLLGTEIFA